MRLELQIDFLRASRVPLDSDDLRLGLSLGLISPPTAVAAAQDSVARGSSDAVVSALAETDPDDVAQVREILGATDPDEADLSPPQSLQKWTYLELSAAYELRHELQDPLGVVEEIYADFGYPDRVAAFVRYMPPPAGEPAGVEEIYNRWASYLAQEKGAITRAET